MRAFILSLVLIFSLISVSATYATTATTAARPPIKRVAPKKPIIKKSPMTSVAPTAQTGATIVKSQGGLISVLQTEGNATVFLALVQQAGLTAGIESKGPFTIFVPSDAAFAKVPQATMDFLKKDTEFLRHIIKYHILGDVLASADIAKYANAKTAQGSNVPFDASSGKVTIDGANIIKADIRGTNGVVHIVDSVLIPPIHQ